MSNYYCPDCGAVASKEPCEHCKGNPPLWPSDWLWCDIVGADLAERTVTVRLRNDEKPTVRIGDAARIFLRRGNQ